MKSQSFDLSLIYYGATVRCTGSISPAYPGRGPSMESAGGDPPEPAEIEDFRIYAEDGAEMEDADGDILTALYDTIMEAADDQLASDMADAADARSDRGRAK